MKTILILTNKEDVTVDFVVRELQRRKISYYRLNTEDIPDKISVNFDLNNNMFELNDKVKDININLLNFDSVYYRRPLLNELNYIEKINLQEVNYLRSELGFILEGIYKILRNKYWLNNVYNIREAENKIYQLQVAQEIGFKIPMSVISNQNEEVNKVIEDCNNDCIIKPIKSGNMKDKNCPKAVFTTKLDKSKFNNINQIESFPLFIQNNIHKQFDLRITVIGEYVFAAQIHSQNNRDSEIDWRRGRKILEHKNHELPVKIRKMCIELTQKMNLNYSAIDMVLDKDGNYVFLEINPNGQWAWIEKRLGFPLSEKIVDLLIGKEKCNVEKY
ncbi:MvdC/MvdD family ATP grasp protein [Clostridium thailandense]|uniref:MvdC/MvdD family ATP grasp protein n=1 Tax=Clostridium thailandense TaxID=2794346 RepID=UPI003989FD3C